MEREVVEIALDVMRYRIAAEDVRQFGVIEAIGAARGLGNGTFHLVDVGLDGVGIRIIGQGKVVEICRVVISRQGNVDLEGVAGVSQAELRCAAGSSFRRIRGKRQKAVAGACVCKHTFACSQIAHNDLDRPILVIGQNGRRVKVQRGGLGQGQLAVGNGAIAAEIVRACCYVDHDGIGGRLRHSLHLADRQGCFVEGEVSEIALGVGVGGVTAEDAAQLRIGKGAALAARRINDGAFYVINVCLEGLGALQSIRQ